MLGVFTAEGVLTLHLFLTFSDTDFLSPIEDVQLTHTNLEKVNK